MSQTTVTQYLTNVGHAILNRKEHFDNGPATTATPTNTNTTTSEESAVAGQSLAVVILLVLFLGIIIIAMMYGAGRLSWCYNTFYGESSGVKWLWAILAAIFSGWYYPIYALFLNPLCGLQRSVGGRR